MICFSECFNHLYWDNSTFIVRYPGIDYLSAFVEVTQAFNELLLGCAVSAVPAETSQPP